MSNMIILAAAAGIVQESETTAGSGYQNPLTPSPREVYLAGATGTTTLVLLLDEVQEVDTFFLGFTNLPQGHAVSVYRGPAIDIPVGSWGTANSARAAPRQHWLGKLAAPVDDRFFSFVIPPHDDPIRIGVAMVGLAFAPARNREKGGGRVVLDTGVAEPLADGGFGIGEGTRKGGFRWVFGDLEEEELDRLYDLAENRGNTRPMLVCEDPDETARLNERIHYGLFDKFEHYERGDPSKHRWALSVTQWV